jgi:site-specific recombinase XerD
MQGLHQLMATLLYRCGLQLMKCLRLSVKDIGFVQSQVVVREGKGEKDRLPTNNIDPIYLVLD